MKTDLFTRNVYSELGNSLEFMALNEKNEPLQGELVETRLVGPLCFAGDELANSIDLPKLVAGNKLIISNGVSNTYGLWSRHCSRDIPKVLLYDLENEQIELAEDRKQVW